MNTNEHNQPKTEKTETYVLIVEINADKLDATSDRRATIEATVRNGAFFYAELPGDLPGKINAHSEKSSNLDEADVVSEIVEEWFTGDN